MGLRSPGQGRVRVRVEDSCLTFGEICGEMWRKDALRERERQSFIFMIGASKLFQTMIHTYHYIEAFDHKVRKGYCGLLTFCALFVRLYLRFNFTFVQSIQ